MFHLPNRFIKNEKMKTLHLSILLKDKTNSKNDLSVEYCQHFYTLLINTPMDTMGKKHRGFDEPTRKQRQRREKKTKRMQREGFEPPNP